MADHVNQTGSNKKSKTTQRGGSIMKKNGSTNSIYRLKYFYFFKSLQAVYTISCSLLNRAILTLNFYNQARSKVTVIIVRKFIKHEQRRKY